VDGIMAARPGALERRLRARAVVRPGGRGTDPCTARAARAERSGDGSYEVRLERRGLGPQAHRGTVTLRTRGRRARAPFSLAEGQDSVSVSVPLQAGKRSVVADVRTRGARGEPVRSVLRVR